MRLSTLLSAALAALTITGFASIANAAPAKDGDYITRAVRSPNGKDVFVRLVKVPKTPASAATRDCAMMKDRAAMKDMCDRMTGERQRGTSAPKG